jgi:hypothetical protein
MTENEGPDDELYFVDPDDMDDTQLDFDCGDDGEICQYAGTWCDWECPYHDQVFGLIEDDAAAPVTKTGDGK